MIKFCFLFGLNYPILIEKDPDNRPKFELMFN